MTERLPAAVERLAAETTVSRLLATACLELAQLAGAPRVSISRVVGDLLVELSNYRLSGGEHPLELFLVTDFPVTQEVIEQDEPRIVLRGDPDADPAETVLLERLGFDSLLMLPLRSRRQRWGLVEVYGDGTPFPPEQVEEAAFVTGELGELLAELEGRA